MRLFLLLLLFSFPASAQYAETYGRDPQEGASSGDVMTDQFGYQRPRVPSDRDWPKPMQFPAAYDAPRGDVFKTPKDDPFMGFHDLFVERRDTPHAPPYPLFAPHF